MKFFLLLCLATANIHASVMSIYPEKIVTPLVDIFSVSNKKLSEEKMEVRVSTYNEKGEIFKGADKKQMEMSEYLKALKQSKAVYQMVPTSASVSARSDKTIYAGTAFHIGHNLVLTNLHVLSREMVNDKKCGGFQLIEHNSTDVYPCKKVHYCNAQNDVCLIEMAPKKICKNLFCSKFELAEMDKGESLKLKENPRTDFTTMLTSTLTCIGNTMGLGIHYSQGRGYEMSPKLIKFYAPLRAGNSGGPLIGDDGLVWGVVDKESAEKVWVKPRKVTDKTPEVYNLAVSMNIVVELMRENVTDQTTLEHFNEAIEP